MDVTLAVKALLMGVVEGLTEFLPISSTGHLILAGSLLGLNDAKAKVFDVVIQTGAMLAIIWEYRARFLTVAAGLFTQRSAQRFVLNLVLAFIPAALLGLAFGSAIKSHLFHPVPVAIAFIAGAFVILWVERRPRRVRVESVDDVTWLDALKIGLAQSFALIPGTSRSGATIIGGMLFGLSRRAATEFSFFLAVCRTRSPVQRVRYDLFGHAGPPGCGALHACGRRPRFDGRDRGIQQQQHAGARPDVRAAVADIPHRCAALHRRKRHPPPAREGVQGG
jgi:undecaprenyl-diphosphatase